MDFSLTSSTILKVEVVVARSISLWLLFLCCLGKGAIVDGFLPITFFFGALLLCCSFCFQRSEQPPRLLLPLTSSTRLRCLANVCVSTTHLKIDTFYDIMIVIINSNCFQYSFGDCTQKLDNWFLRMLCIHYFEDILKCIYVKSCSPVDFLIKGKQFLNDHLVYTCAFFPSSSFSFFFSFLRKKMPKSGPHFGTWNTFFDVLLFFVQFQIATTNFSRYIFCGCIVRYG